LDNKKYIVLKKANQIKSVKKHISIEIKEKSIIKKESL